jgi:hypothetical protein
MAARLVQQLGHLRHADRQITLPQLLRTHLLIFEQRLDSGVECHLPRRHKCGELQADESSGMTPTRRKLTVTACGDSSQGTMHGPR